MSNKSKNKTAKEIIDKFFENLNSLDGMDENTAAIIQKLWGEDRLGRDELLSSLEEGREEIKSNGSKKN